MTHSTHPEIFTPHGVITFRPVAPREDAALLHRWLTDPHSAFWDMQDASIDDIVKQYTRILESDHEQAWILLLRRNQQDNAIPMGLIEDYDPRYVVLNSLLSPTAAAEPGQLPPSDRGLHVLFAPPTDGPKITGLTSSLFAATVRWLCDIRGYRHLAVEPDVRNTAIHAKNAEAGFYDVAGLSQVELNQDGHTKIARIQRCTAQDFYASPAAAQARLSPLAETMRYAELAEQQLIAKAIREFSHERLLRPEFEETAQLWSVDVGPRRLQFRARSYQLEHLDIDPESLCATDGAPLHLGELIASAADQLGIEPSFLHTYIEEIQATVAGRARALSATRPAAAQLRAPALPGEPSKRARAQADYLMHTESAMYEGHPGFVANSGRGGMSLAELQAYAPELGQATPLVWVAARKDACVLATSQEVPNVAEFFTAQLGNLYPRFVRTVEALGGDAADYLPLPLHPWQWDNRITTTFFEHLLSRDLVYIGTSTDLFRPQQSLRTFFNQSQPELPYVKTAVAVRNMGFTRGLSPKYMSTTPAINDWLASQLNEDPEYLRLNVRLLKEIAAVGYTGDTYHRHPLPEEAANDHHKMLAALWRQSPIPFLAEGSVAVTLAGCLYVDTAGESLAAEWIKQSGLPAGQWLDKMLEVYLIPVIHALGQYGIVFMPHSENVILELQDGIPVGSFFKDLGEEAAVVDYRREVPAGLERLQVDDGKFSDAQRALSVHTDVIDGVLRHLSVILDRAGALPAAEFWRICRHSIEKYEQTFPGTLEKLPLLAETFQHSCLNRLQLRNPLTMVNLGDQDSSLIYAGEIDNPLAAG